MLNYTILASKPTIKIPSNADDTDAVICKDLCANSISKNSSISDFKLLEVQPEYVARPDLISLAIYGTDDYTDIICKINGISNPFELNTGMMLLIPNFDSINNLITRSAASDIVTTSNTNIGKKEKINQKAKNADRSPGEQIIGDSTFIIDRTNKIVFY